MYFISKHNIFKNVQLEVIILKIKIADNDNFSGVSESELRLNRLLIKTGCNSLVWVSDQFDTTLVIFW